MTLLGKGWLLSKGSTTYVETPVPEELSAKLPESYAWEGKSPFCAADRLWRTPSKLPK